MNPEKQNGLPVDYRGVHPAKIFQGGGVPIENAAALRRRIQEKMSSLSGEDLVRFNESLKQASIELKAAIERGDINADGNYQAAIFELCK